MALDGIAAVQSRIQEIEQLAGGRGSAASGAVAPSTSTDFAALLGDAMNSTGGGATTDPLGSGFASGGTGTGSLDLMSLVAKLTGGATGAGNSPTAPTGTAQQFLATALAERGKPYVYAANAATSDPDPKAFDCSELTKWAAARVGVTIPDGATAQYLYCRDNGTTMSVEQALRTPGALLFHFGHEPRDLGDIPADGHVAISVGDGVHTIEARGRKYGTNVFEATANRAGFFNRAGMIPGM